MLRSMHSTLRLNGSLSSDLYTASNLLRSGCLVAFPTETVYGLGAVAQNQSAVRRIYEAKGRPSDNPLIVHVASKEQAAKIAHVETLETEMEAKLMKHFWPGPLTILMRMKEGTLAPEVTAGSAFVALRMPEHPIAMQLLKLCKEPVAAPSANTSGRPSPTRAEHVLHDLDGKIEAVVDGGATGMGLESTVVQVEQGQNKNGEKRVTILRPGGVTLEMLEKVAGIGNVHYDVAIDEHVAKAPRAPGMKYIHYAPEAPLIMLDGSERFIRQQLEQAEPGKHALIGLLCPEDIAQNIDVKNMINIRWAPLGKSRTDVDGAAAMLYNGLRALDEARCNTIFATVFERNGLGEAVMNRLSKAANGRVLIET